MIQILRFFKNSKKHLSAALTITLSLLLLCGCGSETAASLPDCPFSELQWESTVADMERLEGNSYVSYDSVYGGTTYTYAKSYKGKDGTVKYMFDDKEQLASIAWAFGSEDADELYGLYEKIHKDIVATHGESGYNTEKQTNYGDVWYLADGNIILSTMVTESQKALQVAFLSPAQSTKAEDLPTSTKPDLIK